MLQLLSWLALARVGCAVLYLTSGSKDWHRALLCWRGLELLDTQLRFSGPHGWLCCRWSSSICRLVAKLENLLNTSGGWACLMGGQETI